ncbi:MAG TPA: hypothetical protein VL549_11610 [Gemmatimonadales bacterium]|nr:hypothetical protein [Gemmatimonadales bacterium]
MDLSRHAALGCALAVLGCAAGWARRPLESLGPVPPRQQVQVWHAGRADVLHGVRLDSMFLDGIPFHKPLSCDSCIVRIPSAHVDSIRFGDEVESFWRSTALVLGVVFGTSLVYCLKHDCGGT